MFRSFLLVGVVSLIASGAGAEYRLVSDGTPVAVWVDPASPPGIGRVANWFADDLQRVCGRRPELVDVRPEDGRAVLVGVIGAGGEIDALVAAGKLDVSATKGQREASVTAVVEGTLVVAGSDKRGAIYGLLDLSREIGVSPWYWWADVPVTQRADVSVSSEAHVRPAPKVQYRGIFLNDEAPALSSWAHEKFGGCNSAFYEKVFELILRMRGNYLWPAMWGRSLFDDDPKSQPLADELGIVLATSHHEPMQRAHVEWARYGKGPWDYDRNAETLREFWREGVRRMGDKESVVTLGMRGDGDEPMSDEANIELLQRIVRDQRQILAEELGRDPTTQPQVWALYKEVQEYYDRGMTVPDDVILLLCDDNWGNVRRLPRPDKPPHAGGYGMYYHFDYVGDPRNYKWLNTNALPRVWEQMHLCWKHGVDKVWVVNVGDLKPMEEPIDFFLTMAYDPDQFPAAENGERIAEWRRAWAAEQFGPDLAAPVADVLARYAKLARRRTPELLTADTYNVENYNEWDRVVDEWRDLMRSAERIESSVPPAAQSAYYQLVLHPVLAFGNVYEMYYAAAKNRAMASDKNPAANDFADVVERCFARDSELTARYHALEGGKWNHMMSQTHIGYTNWQEPPKQTMPAVQRVEAAPTQEASIREAPTRESKSEPAQPDETLPPDTEGPGANGYIEKDNAVSIEAIHHARATESQGVSWLTLDDHGRTGSAMTTIPVTAASTPAGEGPRLEYPIYLTSQGPVTVDAYLSPSHDFYGEDDHGIRFAVSIDDGEPVTVDMHADRSTNEFNANPWRQRVGSSIHIASTPAIQAGPGPHTLKFWRVDTGIVLQKLVVKTGEVAPSYLGPPESPKAKP